MRLQTRIIWQTILVGLAVAVLAFCVAFISGCITLKGIEKAAGKGATVKEENTVGVNWLTKWFHGNRLGLQWQESGRTVYQIYAERTMPWMVVVLVLCGLLYLSASHRAKIAQGNERGVIEGIEEFLRGVGHGEGEMLKDTLKLGMNGRPGAERFERLLAVLGYAHPQRTRARKMMDAMMLWAAYDLRVKY